MNSYYNDNDRFAAQWLRNLIASGYVEPGTVDERSITDVWAGNLIGYRQCHFFAGIGGWSYALRLAGWPEDREVWTGSCPCQPFSSAGKRKGTVDERHLWPKFLRLIRQCRPPTIFGEQVSSKLGREWLAGVRADLEALGYAVGAADLCAAGAGEKAKGRISHEDNSFEWADIVLGAPHIRQRLFWVAHTGRASDERGLRSRTSLGEDGTPQSEAHQREWCGTDPWGSGGDDGLANTDEAGSEQQWCEGLSADRHAPQWHDSDGCGTVGGVADTSAPRRAALQRSGQADRGSQVKPDGYGDTERLGNPLGPRLEERSGERQDDEPQRASVERAGGAISGLDHAASEQVGRARQPWQDSVWLLCFDGKARRIKPGIFPLVDGLPTAVDGLGPVSRVGALRGAGNAIVPQLAAIFIRAFLEINH